MVLLTLLVLLLALAVGVAQGFVHGNLYRTSGRVPTRVKAHWLVTRVALCAVAAWLLVPAAWAWCAVAAMPLSSAAFRYVFSGELRQSPLYLGATSVYDRLWLWWQLGYDVALSPTDHYRRYAKDSLYRAEVHDAGRFAYLAELAPGLLWLLLTLIHTL